LPVSTSLPPFDSGRFLVPLEQLFACAIREAAFSGASLLVAKPGLILFHKTWGRTHQHGRFVDNQTLFDLASLTKPLVTAPLCMRAVGEGRLALDDSLQRFFPALPAGRDLKTITIGQLLNHSSGLPAYEPFYRNLILLAPSARQEALRAQILSSPLRSPPGTVSCYSDLGFMMLLEVLEQIYAKPFGEVAAEFLLEPLDLNSLAPKPTGEPAAGPQPAEAGSPACFLGFRPLIASSDPTLPPRKAPSAGELFAATEYCPWRKRLLMGEVHDENAYCLGGVAAHAGLFGTAHGVHRLLTFLWDVYSDKAKDPVWTAQTVRTFWTKPSFVPDSTWMLGFDTPNPRNSSAGDLFSPRSVGHLGFTGTSFWFDLDRQILIVLLTNRVHPTRDNERLRSFRPLLHNLVMETYNGSTRP